MTALCLAENEEDQVGSFAINLTAIMLSDVPALYHYSLILTPPIGIEIHEGLITSGSKSIASIFDEQNIGFTVIR